MVQQIVAQTYTNFKYAKEKRKLQPEVIPDGVIRLTVKGDVL